MRKVKEARQKLPTEIERKIDGLAPPSQPILTPSAVAEPNTSAQTKRTAALRSCLKKTVASPPLLSATHSTVALQDPFIDVRSPRKDRNLRRVYNVAHMYTPTEPLPLVATLDTAIPVCPATPQQKLRSDGDLQSTVLTPCTKGNILKESHQTRQNGKHIPFDQINASLGYKSSALPKHLALAKDAWSQATSPARPLKRAPYFPGAGQDGVKAIDNRRC